MNLLPYQISLFCNGYCEELCIKKSDAKSHIKRLKQKITKENDLAVSLMQHNSMEHLKGETLPESQIIQLVYLCLNLHRYIVKVLSMFLQVGLRLENSENHWIPYSGYNLQGTISANHQISHLEVIFAIIKFANHSMVLRGCINLRAQHLSIF